MDSRELIPHFRDELRTAHPQFEPIASIHEERGEHEYVFTLRTISFVVYSRGLPALGERYRSVEPTLPILS